LKTQAAKWATVPSPLDVDSTSTRHVVFVDAESTELFKTPEKY
jgi:hypothetical protein